MSTANYLCTKHKVIHVPLFLLFLFAISNACRAQSKLYGMIVDNNGKGIASASVLLLSSKDSFLIKGTISSPSGAYNFENIKGGDYLITSTFTGLAQGTVRKTK